VQQEIDMRTVLGKVVSVTGTAEIVDQHGQRVLLKAGDALHDGDQLITVAGAHVAMQSVGGEMMQFAEQQTVKLTDALSEPVDVVDFSEYAVNPAVIQHILAALQTNDVLANLTPPLASVLHEDTTAFISIAHASMTEQVLPVSSHQADALNIKDILTSEENQPVVHSQTMPMTQVADLMTQATTAVDIGLPDNPLKNLLND
jgi:hypothetical protein